VADGAVVSGTIDLGALSDAVGNDPAALVTRDWSAALGLQLNDNGQPMPLAP
jgi:hypothetical protein